MLDFSRCRDVLLQDGTWSPVTDHAKIGVEAIVKFNDVPNGRIWPGCFFLGDEMGCMKTAQAIIAAQFLYVTNNIDRVVVIAPASVRGVWFDPELGELAKHLWCDLPALVQQLHARIRSWHWPQDNSTHPKRMSWFITNYEFIRTEQRRNELVPFCNMRTMLILDESSAVKNHGADQTEACLFLRKRCGRVLLLNGTPIANSPIDMFSQGEIMDPRILACKSFYQFRARYAVMGGYSVGGKPKQIVGWKNLPDLQQRFKPYMVRRLKNQLNLPKALPPITLEVPLKNEPTWKIYKAMRDEMVAWLSDSTVAVVSQAAVKTMRLAQITSGFLGGVESEEDATPKVDPELWQTDFNLKNLPDFAAPFAEKTVTANNLMQMFSHEKQDFVIQLFKEWQINDPNLKLLVWCQFRPELERLMRAVAEELPGVIAGQIHGDQKPAERAAALRLLDPRTAPKEPVFFAGTYGTGSLGLNFTASHTVVYLSYDYSFWKYLQSGARVDRPGQTHPVSSFDIVATGPKGQKTTDHIKLKVRRGKADIANWTTAAWVDALLEE